LKVLKCDFQKGVSQEHLSLKTLSLRKSTYGNDQVIELCVFESSRNQKSPRSWRQARLNSEACEDEEGHDKESDSSDRPATASRLSAILIPYEFVKENEVNLYALGCKHKIVQFAYKPSEELFSIFDNAIGMIAPPIDDPETTIPNAAARLFSKYCDTAAKAVNWSKPMHTPINTPCTSMICQYVLQRLSIIMANT
jgi:hypothetical protein